MWQTGDLLTSVNRKGVGEDYLIGYKQGMMGTRKHGPKFNDNGVGPHGAGESPA